MPTDQYDAWGWYTDELTGRSAGVAPSNIPAQRVVGQPYPNWAGHEWVMQTYVKPPEPEPITEPEVPTPPEPEWAWFMDPESFTDRLGSAVTMALDTSSDTAFVAIRADFARRRWIDLKDVRVIATVRYLAGHPMPGLPTLAEPLLTAAQVDSILNTPVNEWENLVLRKLYFS